MPKKKNDRITCGFNCQTQMEKQAVGYLGLDCRERVLFCDQAAQTILNRPQQDILEQPITNFYPEFSVAACAVQFARSLPMMGRDCHTSCFWKIRWSGRALSDA